MVFIHGTNFEAPRLVTTSLQSFYGIGAATARTMMAAHYIHPTARIGALTETQRTGLANALGAMTLENDLRRQMRENIRRLRDMGTYRGRRHAMGLPVRGQNTRGQIYTAIKLNRMERRG